ncbi:uncharacterized protein [Physcomitrium patens]|uniref:Methyltransferase type 11 domain-containing protein n=1 Tax=Physcomitrium patens TaxID=3218 RepID=A0A2K1KUZ1_PHYPA|nr:uncharacterized protein LOC112280289 [Physcomitrium patens]PNR57599.1 hypothetical protein PHYPA_004593 [Physcomitrium patens]|eukprot:XP_024371384.1 uncharacterized protein LOC112280289 [Physcomitrella patens]
MTRALGMAATSVSPALMNVARAVEAGASSCERVQCAVTRNSGARHLHQLRKGFLSVPRRRFLLGLQGSAAVGEMLGMMFSVPARAQAAGVSEAEEVLKKVQWPEQFPFTKEDFARYDESPDTVFYDAPRFVTHIDDPAIRALTRYYSTALPPSNTPGTAILDMCSSWISHYPKGYKQERIAGLGLNEEELKRNEVLTEYVVRDLNIDPTLPYADNSFDVITNVVSVDYLTKPLEIFKEMHRVLKPGGLAAMSFSNRCFFTKAISIWTSTGDVDHVMIVGSYFHYAGGFEPPQALDISPNPGRSDPMYIVYSRKLKA